MTDHESGMSEEIRKMILDKMNDFNRGKTADKGRYYIVLPNAKTVYYTLWFYDPSATYHPTVYLNLLELTIIGSVNKAIHLLRNSFAPISIVREIQTALGNGDNIITFGKYRGYYLHDIYTIDPRYVVWLAAKYEAHVKSEIRFKELAGTYAKVYLDLQTRRQFKRPISRFVGAIGEKLEHLRLRIRKVRVEDDYYKTRIVGGTEYFYADQLLTAEDVAGNLFLLRIKARDRSLTTRTVAAGAHKYQVGEMLAIKSAKVLKHVESHDIRYTRIGYILLE